MKTALLVCDHIKEEFRHISGEYVDMYQHFLPDFDFESYLVCDGEFPEDVNDHDVYLCTGSSFSVYDDVDWILKLKKLVRSIYSNNKTFIGICFGHQMIAHALGGRVEKMDFGWCVGAHNFKILNKKVWMDPALDHANLLMLCRDQVVELPEEAEVISSADSCKIGMFTVADNILGIQGHPEFATEYLNDIIQDRKDKIGAEKAKEALVSLESTLSNRAIFSWVKKFSE